MGHVVRCAALALELRSRSIPAVMLLGEHSDSTAKERLEEQGLRVERAEGWLDPADPGHHARCVIVDLPGDLQHAFQGLGPSARVAVLDDNGGRDLARADLVINQNPGTSGLYPDVAAERLLTGPAYALLRPQFAAVRKSAAQKSFAASDNRLLVILGAGSVEAELSEVIRALEATSRRLECRVMVPREVPDVLVKAAAASRHAVELCAGVRDVSPHMMWADLAITAAGSTLWELACLGVPMLSVVLGEDQARNATEMTALGCARRLTWDNGPGHDLPAAVDEALGDSAWRQASSEAGRNLVDGKGAARVADVVLKDICMEERQ